MHIVNYNYRCVSTLSYEIYLLMGDVGYVPWLYGLATHNSRPHLKYPTPEYACVLYIMHCPYGFTYKLRICDALCNIVYLLWEEKHWV